MTWVSFLLGVLISSIPGVFWHLIRGGSFGKMLVYLIAGWVGFWVGQYTANRLEIYVLSIGALHLGLAILGSVILVLLAGKLGHIEFRKDNEFTGDL
ncbi:MAG: hypothetical protein JXA19_00645 [Anaerolineales bacterium]|nr:hypothetical protein [Anaerolineales bacterium]